MFKNDCYQPFNNVMITFAIALKVSLKTLKVRFFLLFNLFLLLSSFFIYYLLILLYFLILFMSHTVLFQLSFNYIYNIFKKKIQFQLDKLFQIDTKLIQKSKYILHDSSRR